MSTSHTRTRRPLATTTALAFLVATTLSAPPSSASAPGPRGGAAALTLRPGAAAPAPRILPALAQAPGQPTTTLLFGGTDSHDLADTWTFDGTWQQQRPATHPSGRTGAAIAYDPIRATTVLFGGIAGGVSSLDDTWIWNGATWREAAPAHHPSARDGASMAFDGTSGELLLFGGKEWAGPTFDETWAWNGTDWRHLEPSSRPPATANPTMMADPVNAGVVLYDRSSTDTWTWTGATWTRHGAAEVFPPGDHPLPADISTVGAGRLFAGTRQYQLVWTWAGTAWSPSGRVLEQIPRGPAGPVADTLLTYSAVLGSAEGDGTWLFDPDTGRWQRIVPAFYSVPPRGVLDTRPDDQYGYVGAKPTAGDVVVLQLERSPLPGGNDWLFMAAGSTAVLQVSATEATADGYVTVGACSPLPPLASNLNVRAGETVSALVFARLGDHASVCIYTQSGTHLVADLVGYVPHASTFSGDEPVRVLDTRPTWSVGFNGDKPSASSIVRVPTGRPRDLVVLNVTGTEPTADGYVSVVPCASPTLPPTTSNLNLVRGETRANLVLTHADPAGDVCLFTQSGTHLVVDRLGDFGPLDLRGTNARVLDTRTGAEGGVPPAKPGPDESVQVVLSDAVVPRSTAAVLLQVTGTEATADGFVTAWACDDERPVASVLNLARGGTRTNVVLLPIGPSRTVCLFTQSGTHLVVDVIGAL